MKLGTLMTGKTPDPTFPGSTVAEDMILALDMSADGTGADADFLVVYDGATQITASLNSTTNENTFWPGTQENRVGTKRQFSIASNIVLGDELQESLLSHTVKYGKGSIVEKRYIWFNMLTGKGERGTATVDVTSDGGGTAGDDQTYAATITAKGVPEAYTYAADSGSI